MYDTFIFVNAVFFISLFSLVYYTIDITLFLRISEPGLKNYQFKIDFIAGTTLQVTT